MNESYAVGKNVVVLSCEGGLFYGRIGRISRVVEWLSRTNIEVRFDDGGPGSDTASGWWFAPDELQPVCEKEPPPSSQNSP